MAIGIDKLDGSIDLKSRQERKKMKGCVTL